MNIFNKFSTKKLNCVLLWPWGLFFALLSAPVFVRDSWISTYLAQTAAMIVFALSYNLLLGETGLLSFGHAAFSGLAGFAAAHIFNRFGMALPLPLLPFVGGVAGMACGAVLGFFATRRAGTAFAMITLGIGELTAAVAWTLPAWFGDESGVAIDRTHGAMPWARLTFGPAREAYAVVAMWCAICALAIFALLRTPLARLANAVRDNPTRAAALGCDPKRIRYLMVICSAFFAGVAGTLSLLNIELASLESVGMASSGAVLIATVIGGAGTFFGPIMGAVVLTFFTIVLASLTRAWPLYFGGLFVAVVMYAPDGLASLFKRFASQGMCHVMAILLWLTALVLVIEWLYARQFSSAGILDTFQVWSVAMALMGIGWLMMRRSIKRQRECSQ